MTRDPQNRGKEKAGSGKRNRLCSRCLALRRDDADAATGLLELHHAVLEGEQGEIATEADILADVAQALG